MNCPGDGTTLAMSERNGIEIDYCPTCRGVWLDRGELDKIIERAGPTQRSRDDDPDHDHDNHPEHGSGGEGRRRRRGLLGDLFEFGG